MDNEKVNILIIGNGFDLAHNLPTKYTDFLEFIKIISDILFNKKDVVDYSKLPKLKEIIECDRGNVRNNLYSCYSEWEELIKDNFWIEYFMNSDTLLNENWIDFESEIREVVKKVHFMMIDNGYQISDFVRRTGVAIADDLLINDHDKSYQEIYNEGYSQIINKGLSIKEVSEYMDKYMNEHNLPEYDVIKYGYLEEKLLNDLKRLIRALELYLTRYVAQITITQKLPDIEEQQFTYILSFNYTDTYSKLYSNEEKIICSYIHGKAVETNNIDNNKMVLGIDEYLADEDRKKDVRFVDFTKFYQRVYKQTGSEYRYWINTINNDSTPTVYEDCILDDGKSGIRVLNKYNLFILGHSLDVADKDVLSDFLLNDKLKITIFYYNEKQRAQQIRNLIKLIGSKELIKRTGGYNQTIYFRKQKDAIFNAAKS